VRQEEAAAVHHAPEVHAQEPGQVVEVELGHGRGHGDAGVVHEQVDGPVLRDDCVREGRHGGAVGDVGRVRRDAHAVRRGEGARPSEARGIHVHEGQRRTAPRELESEAAADPARGARHDRDGPGPDAHGADSTRARAASWPTRDRRSAPPGRTGDPASGRGEGLPRAHARARAAAGADASHGGARQGRARIVLGEEGHRPRAAGQAGDEPEHARPRERGGLLYVDHGRHAPDDSEPDVTPGFAPKEECVTRGRARAFAL
jgi:hypothetical protein